MSTIIDMAMLAGLTERSVVHNGEHRAVSLKREYAFAIDDVWSAWTEPDRLTRWLGEVRGQRRQGSTLQLCMSPPDSDIATITVLVCEAPNRLAVKWEWPGESDSFVDLRLERVGPSRTALTLEHIALLDETVTSYGAGWEDFLVRFGVLLDGDEPNDVTGTEVDAAVKPLWTDAARNGGADERWPVIDDEQGQSVVHTGRWFAHPVDAVWTALTTPDAISNWFGSVSGDTSLGGTFTVTFDGGSASGVVQECRQASQIVLAWTWSHQDFETLVTVDFAEADGGTRVSLRQSGVIGPALGYAAGWSAYLGAAQRHLEGKQRSEEAWQADWDVAKGMIRLKAT